MSTEAKDFNVEEFLTTTEFTIPVKVTETKVHPGTTPPTRTLMVTYQFDDAIADEFSKGRETEVEEPDPTEAEPERTKKVPQRRSLTLNEQLIQMVVKVEGVTQELTAEFWRGVPFKYRQAILDAILKDVYPNVKTSTGS